jgi:hypothetical protein
VLLLAVGGNDREGGGGGERKLRDEGRCFIFSGKVTLVTVSELHGVS